MISIKTFTIFLGLLVASMYGLRMQQHKCVGGEIQAIYEKCDEDEDKFLDNEAEWKCGNEVIYEWAHTEFNDDSARFFGAPENSDIPVYFSEDAFNVGQRCDKDRNFRIDISEIECAKTEFKNLWQLQEGGIGNWVLGMWEKCDSNKNHYIDGEEERACSENYIKDQFEEGQYMSESASEELKEIDEKEFSITPTASITIYNTCDYNRNGKIDPSEMPCVERGYIYYYSLDVKHRAV